MSDLNEEVISTAPSPSVSNPWLSTNDTQVQIKSNISFLSNIIYQTVLRKKHFGENGTKFIMDAFVLFTQ